MRRLLDVAWRKNPQSEVRHFVVKKRPSAEHDAIVGQITEILEEQDANTLGLDVIWVDEYDEVEQFLLELAA